MKGGGALVTVMVTLAVVSAVNAAVYTVGDGKGWGVGVSGWENNKKFQGGDQLVFRYDSSSHNVLKVNKLTYDSCIAQGSSQNFNTGNDRITLSKGPNYFICGFPGHCQAGMKIAAIAA